MDNLAPLLPGGLLTADAVLGSLGYHSGNPLSGLLLFLKKVRRLDRGLFLGSLTSNSTTPIVASITQQLLRVDELCLLVNAVNSAVDALSVGLWSARSGRPLFFLARVRSQTQQPYQPFFTRAHVEVLVAPCALGRRCPL